MGLWITGCEIRCNGEVIVGEDVAAVEKTDGDKYSVYVYEKHWSTGEKVPCYEGCDLEVDGFSTIRLRGNVEVVNPSTGERLPFDDHVKYGEAFGKKPKEPTQSEEKCVEQQGSERYQSLIRERMMKGMQVTLEEAGFTDFSEGSRIQAVVSCMASYFEDMMMTLQKLSERVVALETEKADRQGQQEKIASVLQQIDEIKQKRSQTGPEPAKTGTMTWTINSADSTPKTLGGGTVATIISNNTVVVGDVSSGGSGSCRVGSNGTPNPCAEVFLDKPQRLSTYQYGFHNMIPSLPLNSTLLGGSGRRI
jgi:hypothetical protein